MGTDGALGRRGLLMVSGEEGAASRGRAVPSEAHRQGRERMCSVLAAG